MLMPPKRITLEPIWQKKGEFEESEGYRFAKFCSRFYLERYTAFKTMRFNLIHPDRLGRFVADRRVVSKLPKPLLAREGIELTAIESEAPLHGSCFHLPHLRLLPWVLSDRQVA